MLHAGRIEPPRWVECPATRAVLGALARGGVEARFAGGCVRDSFAGRPIGDIDIATPAQPDQVIDLVRAAGLKAVATGLSHGTVTAIADGVSFEITTLRRDIATDGRHATVAFTGDWAVDAARRDFTFNALFLDPDGLYFDWFGGLRDLRAGCVRFVGDPDRRIIEDYLRILRFFRFFAWYGEAPANQAALAACRRQRDGLAQLSGERIRTELLKLLAAPDPVPSLRLMADSGVLGRLLPVPFTEETARALTRLARAEAAAGRCDGERRLVLLLRNRAAGGGRGVGSLAERLKLANRQAKRLASALDLCGQVPGDPDDPALPAMVYRYGEEAARDAGLLDWACTSRDPSVARAWLQAGWPVQELPVSGADVVALGVAPGPAVGAILKAAESHWLESGMGADRAALLDYLAELVRTRQAPDMGGKVTKDGH